MNKKCPYCGSTRQDSSMLDSIEPYNTKAAVEYKPEYMTGFMAERYTIKVEAAQETAKAKINGQTGKVSGKTPISWARVAPVVLGVAAFLLLIHFALNL